MKVEHWILGLSLVVGLFRDLSVQRGHSLLDYPTHYDVIEQLSAARALSDGLGLSVPRVDTTGGQLSFYRETLRSWPPGFSLLAAPLLAWLRDPLRTLFGLHIVAAILFYAGLGSIVVRLLPIRNPFVFLAVLGGWLAFSSPLARLPPSDDLALAALTLALAAGVWWQRLPDRPLLKGLLLGLPLLLACSLRFACWPLAVGLPLLLVFRGPGRSRWISLAIAIAIPVTGIVFIRLSMGPIAQQMNSGHGWWHLERLRRFFPFPASLFNGEDMVRVFRDVEERTFRPLLCLLYLIPAVPLFRKPPSERAGRDFFWRAGLFFTVTTVGLLTITSLVRDWEWTPDFSRRWTPVQEPRYFMPLWVPCVIAFALWLSEETRSVWRRGGLALYGFLMAIAVARGVLHWREWIPKAAWTQDAVGAGAVVRQIVRASGPSVVWIAPNRSWNLAGDAKMAGAGVVPLSRLLEFPPHGAANGIRVLWFDSVGGEISRRLQEFRWTGAPVARLGIDGGTLFEWDFSSRSDPPGPPLHTRCGAPFTLIRSGPRIENGRRSKCISSSMGLSTAYRVGEASTPTSTNCCLG